MKKYIAIVLVLFFVSSLLRAQTRDESAIRSLLAKQVEAWNRGSIEEFMQGYWKNDSLMFIGKSGVTYGYQQTLDNYKRGYPNKDYMGTLKFDILQVKKIAKGVYFVVGKWFLKRSAGDVGGHYSLLLRKIKGNWNIVADHSS